MKKDSKAFSRRNALKAGVTVVASGLATVTARAQDPDAGKMAKSVVQYVYHPAKNGNHCAICANFLPPEACRVVAGKIDPNGSCQAFVAKKK